MKINKSPKITIVTITFNAENYIEKTILSVLNQKYTNVEYIIIDGNSYDNTMDIVNKYKDKIDLIISEPDNGIYDAMNKGLKNVKGTWINFLNAGDIFYSNNVLNDISLIMTNNDIEIIYGDWINIGGYKEEYITSMSKLDMNNLASKFQMNHQSLFVKKLALPMYDTSYKIKADYQWVIDIVRKKSSSNIYYVNLPLVYYDIDGVSAKYLLQNVKEYIFLSYKNFGLLQVFKNTPIYLKYYIKYILSFIQ